jgi:hypothetical protein
MKSPGIGMRLAIISWVFLPIVFVMLLVFHHLGARMSMETWASYAGKLQARIWFQEGRYRMLELSSTDRSEFTGRKDGPFEIWTWPGNTNEPTPLFVPRADQDFVDAVNDTMKDMWAQDALDKKRIAEENLEPGNAGNDPRK